MWGLLLEHSILSRSLRLIRWTVLRLFVRSYRRRSVSQSRWRAMECWPSPNTYYSPSLLEVVSGRVVLVQPWVSVVVCREVDCSWYCTGGDGQALVIAESATFSTLDCSVKYFSRKTICCKDLLCSTDSTRCIELVEQPCPSLPLDLA